MKSRKWLLSSITSKQQGDRQLMVLGVFPHFLYLGAGACLVGDQHMLDGTARTLKLTLHCKHWHLVHMPNNLLVLQ